MKSKNISLAVLLVLFVWAGMVAGISFLEAPVKFTAPHITLALGLGIGRLVFGYLNKMEILWCGLLLTGCYLNRQVLRSWLSVSCITVILLLQTFWLLPALDARAMAIMAGQNPPESSLHFLYVLLELMKIGLLLRTGMAVYRQQLSAEPKTIAVSSFLKKIIH